MAVKPMPKPGLTTDEVAKLLNVTTKRVRELVQSNRLDAMQLYPRLWFFTHEAVERCRIALITEGAR